MFFVRKCRAISIRNKMHTNFDIQSVRQDFPILSQQIYGKPLVYFDSAATTQKPQVVIDAIAKYYCTINANVHRGVHRLSQDATQAFEESRATVARFLNARNNHEIIFTRGTTEAINLVAASFGDAFVMAGDEILVSAIEHHSNIVPWQMLCQRKGAVLKVLPVDDRGVLCIDMLDKLITSKTKLIAVNHVSNTLGTINPVQEIVRIAHDHDVPVLVDGAQGMAHIPLDVQAIDCDFYTFSAHKVYGPTGFGGLYGKEVWLEKMPPYQGGGEMIKDVTFEKTTYNELPYKFEAGTPHIAGAIGFKAALDYLSSLGLSVVAAYEDQLLHYATERLSEIDDMRIIGTAPCKASVISMLIGDIHPYDAGTIIDRLGIALRTGNHCTQPIMERFDIPGTLRASFALYNTFEEIDLLVDAVYRVKQMFG